MTTRGIRRKKSYLVDAKIAVCGQKAVGKSGKRLSSRESVDEKQTIAPSRLAVSRRHEKIICVKYVHLEPFFFHRKKNKKLLSRREEKIIL